MIEVRQLEEGEHEPTPAPVARRHDDRRASAYAVQSVLAAPPGAPARPARRPRGSPLMTYTSMSPLPRTSASTIEPRTIALPQRAVAACRPRSCVTLRVARVGQDRRRSSCGPLQRDGLGAELLGQPQRLDDASRASCGQAQLRGRLDVGRRSTRRPGASAMRLAARTSRADERARADADEHALAASARSARSRARAGSRASARPRARRCGAAPARAARSGCPCGRSCRRASLRPARAGRPCPRCRRWSSSSGGRSISSTSSACSKTESGTVSRTMHAGDLGHHVVQALDVLDVDGGVDVDAGVEQLDARPASAWRGASPARWCARARRPG